MTYRGGHPDLFGAAIEIGSGEQAARGYQVR
jgi:hypothetical protein